MFQYAAKNKLFTPEAVESSTRSCETNHRMASHERDQYRTDWSTRMSQGHAKVGPHPTQTVAYARPTRDDCPERARFEAKKIPLPITEIDTTGLLHEDWMHATAIGFGTFRVKPW